MRHLVATFAMVACVACSAFPEPTSQQATQTDVAQAAADSVAPSDSGGSAGKDAGSSSADSVQSNDVLGDSAIFDSAQQDTVIADGQTTDSDPGNQDDTQSTAADAADTSDPLAGYYPTSCGAPNQGLIPVDCTAKGDAKAMCVFSNHCMCTDGFECETKSPFGKECNPGDICVPEA